MRMAKLKGREALKEEMIGLAVDMIAADGLRSLQARAIAEAAGCSVGTIYNVFDGIDGLILEANRVTLRQLGFALREASKASDGRPFAERLLALAFAYLAFAIEHRRRWKAVFEHVMADRRLVPQWYRDEQAPLIAVLAGILPAEVRVEERLLYASTLFSAGHGIVVLALDNKLADAFDRARTEAQLAALTRTMAAGMERIS
jgi:AcrR family transcriptional regulator